MKSENHVDEQPVRKRVKVLLIEDNPGDMRLIRELLGDFQQSNKDNPSFEIVWADNLHKGLELLASENIDTLLLDLSLPDSRGYETFLKVKNRASNIPITILTGLDDETVAVKTLQDGAQDYLIKGQVDSAMLGRAILYAIERRQIQAREEKNPVRILLVEDHDGDARLISISLTDNPSFIFDLTHVKDLGEAFHVLEKRSFDIILLDLLLPDSHGIETFLRIRERAQEIPVIVITVLGDERHAIQALRSGAQDYLVKGKIIGDLLVRRIQYAIERYRSERDRQIRSAEEVYRSLTIHAQSGIYIIQNRKMHFFNPHIMRNYGFSEKDLLNMDILNLVYPDDREMVRNKAIRMLKGESATPYEFRIIDKDGRVRWLIESVSSITYKGKPSTLGNFLDITEQKNLSKQLEESQKQLVRSEKLAAIGQLSAGVAHEILNPINIMGMKLQMLEMTEALSEKTKDAIRTCENQIKRVTKITRDLQQFARVSEKQITSSNINELIEQVFSLMGPRIKVEDVKVDARYQADLPLVPLDRDRMGQVILNLINNALDAMKGRPERVLRVITELTDKNVVRLSFSDTGTGIPPEILSRIFDPFFTTKEEGKGTGLGLSISYGIIEDHGGRIWAENNDKGSATFFIELPVRGSSVS